MLHAELMGNHLPGNGKGITAEELYQLLKSLPYKARNNYIMVSGRDVIGIGIAHSDQAEKWDFKLYILAESADGVKPK